MINELSWVAKCAYHKIDIFIVLHDCPIRSIVTTRNYVANELYTMEVKLLSPSID